MARNTLARLSSLGLIAALAGCGGGGGGSPAPSGPSMFAISGTINGLVGDPLVVRFNSGVDTAVVFHANGPFTGPLFPRGGAYTVVVKDQPTRPTQTCVVTNGTGTLNAPVNDVVINCTTNTYRVGGTVAGLAGVKLAIQLNGGTPLPITQDGAFTFDGTLASGTNYTVTVQSQPVGPGQDCVVAQGPGQVASFDVMVAVTCTTLPLSSITRDLAAKDMVYNPVAGELYVSAPDVVTPGFIVIDPRTGETLRTVPTLDHGSVMALSDDGQFLYAFMNGRSSIQRFTVPALALDKEFSLGTAANGQPLKAADIRVAPGNARTVAVTREYLYPTSPQDYGLAIYDDGVQRADTIGDAMPVWDVHPDGALWSPDGKKLYSFDVVLSSRRCLHESAVSAAGVTYTGCTPLREERSFGRTIIDINYANRNLQMAGGRIITSAGAIFDPVTRTQAGAFRTQGQAFAPDVAANKVFYASGASQQSLTFERFDLARMTRLESRDVTVGPGAVGQVNKLVRWGAYGLTAMTDSQLVFVSGTFVSEPTGKITLPPGTLVESTGNSGAYQYRVYKLPATDVLWDTARTRLYAAVTGEHAAFGNSIAAINVDIDQVTAGAAAGSEPQWMAASDDGTRMYVTNYASSSVMRIDLTTMFLNTVFLLNYPGQGLGYALAAVPQPGDASSFAFTEYYPALATRYTRMITGTALRPQSFDEPVSALAFTSPTTLFANNPSSSALDFYEIGVVPNGLQQVRDDQYLFNTGRMTVSGGLLYSDYGYSIDPATRTLVRAYNPPTGGASRAFRANPARDRGYQAFTDSFSQPLLLVYRLSDATLLATVPLPLSLQTPISLASMDGKGVAITTTAGKTVIVQGPDL